MIKGKDLIKEYFDSKERYNNKIEITTIDKCAKEFDQDIQLGNDSIDLRISDKGYKIKCNYNYINTLDKNIDKYFKDIEIPKEGYIINPGETIIVNTVEKVKLSGDIMGQVVARTRYARMGLSVCIANKFQSYSDAIIALQLTNHNLVPIKIFPYQKLAQLIIYSVEGMPREARGNYKNESVLKKPIIDDDELNLYSEEEKAYISRQQPKEIKGKPEDGVYKELSDSERKNVKSTNRDLSLWTKITGATASAISLVIGILASHVEVHIIMILGISNFLVILFNVILDYLKEKNKIND